MTTQPDPDPRKAIVAAREAERARVAQEIHDGPAQGLANAIFRIELVERALDRGPDATRLELAELRSLLERQLDELRGFISQLRPLPPDEDGLERALREAAESVRLASGLEVEVTLEGPAGQLDGEQQAVVLRIAQEALRNVRKHAAAHHAWLRTSASAGGGFQLEVGDDGVGFVVPAHGTRADRHFGLQFMRDRAVTVGAQLEIDSAAGRGAAIRLTIRDTQRR